MARKPYVKKELESEITIFVYQNCVRAPQPAQTQTPPIGINGLHIVTHVRSEGLVLVSNNLIEIERVARLRVSS